MVRPEDMKKINSTDDHRLLETYLNCHSQVSDSAVVCKATTFLMLWSKGRISVENKVNVAMR